jgi:acyl-CoA synthetase (AMP-forming)/AMP-acid ligase II
MSRFSQIDLGASTFVEILRTRASRQPGRLAYTFLLDRDSGEKHLTYGELDSQARAIAGKLQVGGAHPGDRALLLYPSGFDYLASFFGCLYAGVVAVPAYPPRNARNTPRILAIMRNAQAAIALTSRPLLANLQLWFASTGGADIRWLVTDELDDHSEKAWSEPPLTAETLALLQYTSGSTGTPKGVRLSHGNLIHNSSLIQQSFAVTPESRIVSWLPPYHDMGLIGCLLQPLYVGGAAVLLSPMSFLQRPLRWLRAISQAKGTHSGGPNFAYELCLRKITAEQRTGLELRSWRVAFNGAEPVRNETIRNFTSAFSGCGLRQDTFSPCYGLAESTLLVSGGLSSGPPRLKTVRGAALEHRRVRETTSTDAGSLPVVSCGPIPPGQHVVIANPETLSKCDGQIGEIWVAGPSVSEGYWSLPEQTDRTFRAYLSDTGEGPFLRTGDLGFVDSGELFVTGRIKDLVIVCGRNIHPQDIELTVEQSHPSLIAGGGAAFSVVIDGREELVVVQEQSDRSLFERDAVTRAIRGAVSDEHGIQVHAVEFIRPGLLPKTSSGKVQRYACKERYLMKTLDA